MHRRVNRRHGFLLLLAVVLIGAVGVTLGLVSRHFVGLTVSARYMMLDARAAQLLADGQAWAAVHADRCSALAPGGLIELPITDLPSASLTATLQITRDEPAGADLQPGEAANGASSSRVKITAIVRQEKYASTARGTFALPARGTSPAD